MSLAVEAKIKGRILKKRKGWCFTPKDFTDLGSSEAIRVSLHRLESKGVIRRLTHGLYDYPKKDKQLGIMPPNIEKVVAALSEKYKILTQPSGAYAANLLGLTEQVPGKIVLLTDGATKVVKIGKREIHFKKTTPKNMKVAGSVSGLIIQSLRFLGKANVDSKTIKRIKSKLNKKDKILLKQDADLAPVWIAKIIKKELLDEGENG